jgi:hypothetical protein
MLPNFNSHVWDAALILLPAAVIMVLVARHRVAKYKYYHFDPNRNLGGSSDRGNYEPHFKRYQELAKLAITLSAGAIAFLISQLTADKPPSVILQHLQASAPIVIGFFGLCIALMIGFMIVQTVWYEEYCHSLKYDSYSKVKFAISSCLGWTGLVSLVLGFTWLGFNLF